LSPRESKEEVDHRASPVMMEHVFWLAAADRNADAIEDAVGRLALT
jgi:hypothetical protein